jgi:hypothetical protein
MNRRRNARTVTAGRWLLGLAVLTLVMGCDNGMEPPKFTTIDDAKAFDSTRSDVKKTFDAAAVSASDAVHGGEVREGDRVRDLLCDELYSKEFRALEIGGSFVVEGQGREAVIDGVRTAWEKQGWDVSVTAPDRVALETTTSTGVRVIGSATVHEGAADPTNVGVSVRARTGCLKVPKSVADGL